MNANGSNPNRLPISTKKNSVKMNGKNRTYEIENGNASVSDAAKEWIQTYLVSGDGELEQEDLRKWLAPTGPVAAGAHWTGDVATIASALFRGAEVDPKHSTASGKLGTVKVQDGVHTGHWDAKATLKIKKSESGTEWQEGQQDVSISVDGSLELDKSNAEDLRIDLKFGGKGEVKGKDPGKIEQKWQTTVKSKRIPDKTAEKKP